MADLIPVDHDPFMGAAGTPAELVPVDYDPFARPPGAAPTLVPIDHDPFADSPGTAATLVPVDHDPFADPGGTAATLVPVDHDASIGEAGTAAGLVSVDHNPFAAPRSPADLTSTTPVVTNTSMAANGAASPGVGSSNKATFDGMRTVAGAPGEAGISENKNVTPVDVKVEETLDYETQNDFLIGSLLNRPVIPNGDRATVIVSGDIEQDADGNYIVRNGSVTTSRFDAEGRPVGVGERTTVTGLDAISVSPGGRVTVQRGN
jgi:hypothetical protein